MTAIFPYFAAVASCAGFIGGLVSGVMAARKQARKP
jgi:hypothetical protein